MTSAVPADDIAAMRRFNRFYTGQLGLLDDGLLHSGLSLAEARLVYELGHAGQTSAAALSQVLQLDAGYVSRLLARLQARRLLRRSGDASDGRVQRLQLSKAGTSTFEALDAASREQLAGMTAHLSEADRRDLLAAMADVQRLLQPRAAAAAAPAPLVLRDPRPGDLGWVVHRQALLYAQEHGWGSGFEALVAQIVADFVQHFDPRRERCWIAEQNQRIVGSIFLVKDSDTDAKLRLLYVERSTRGQGVGARLVDECIRDARAKGYRRLTLWTNSVLAAARRIYEARGFLLVKEEPHRSFGHDLMGQYWALDL